MSTVLLPDGTTTSQLAMGSAGIGATSGRREPLALLEAAFDAGIRHFDTAPLYGTGLAEGCMGEFLARHKDQVTVTTKYGLLAPKIPPLMKIARTLIKPVVTAVPGLRKRVQRTAGAARTNNSGPRFSVAGAQASLENSLRALRVERINIWLLHEASAPNLDDEALLRFMEGSVKAGKIGSFGVGGAARNIPEIYSTRRAYCHVIQCEWDALEPEGRYLDTFPVRYHIFKIWPARIAEYLKLNSTAAKDWSDEVGMDLTAPGTVNALTLRAAMLSRSGGIILFESRNKHNIASNARASTDPSLEQPALHFYNLIRREGAAMLPQARQSAAS